MLDETLSKKKLLQCHISAIRHHRVLKDVPIYFIPEANLGEEAPMMSEWVQPFAHVSVPRWCKDGGLGVETTERTKIEGFNLVDGILSHNGFRFMKDFIVSNPYELQRSDINPEKLRESSQKECITQLARLRYWVEIPKKLGAKPHVHVSGKCDDKGNISSKINDDVSITMLIAVTSENNISRSRSLI